MYVIADLETRNVLTYRDGSRISYASEGLARNHAEFAQARTGHPHAVMNLLGVGLSNIDRLGRQPAPWL